MFTNEQKDSSKGVTKHAQAQLTHDMFESVLMGDHGSIRTLNYRIGSINYQLYTIETNKIALTTFRDRQYYIASKHSLPYGHKAIQEKLVYQEMALDEEWGLTNIEEQIEEGDQSIRMLHFKYQMEPLFSKTNNLISHLLIRVSIIRSVTLKVS